MIRSSLPSPLTSPAPETLNPLQSDDSAPLITKPPPPSSSKVDRSMSEIESVPKTTSEVPAPLLPPIAPMIRSSLPSPLTSPAPETLTPLWSNKSTPFITKPLPALASISSSSMAEVSEVPKTT